MNAAAETEVAATAEAAALLCQSQALAVADIHPSPTNPRKTFPEAEHAEMVKSVTRHGVMQPILVRPWPEAYAFEGERPKYELIAGERRYRAARDAGVPFIPGIVRNLDDHETLELQIIENLHRKDLNELEEAEGYELMTKRYGYTAEQLAEKIDKSKAYIYARLKLTALCKEAREAFREGVLDASRALLIARIPIAKLQIQAMTEILECWGGPLNYRKAAEHIQGKYMLKLAEAPFPRGDADLVPEAGKCHPCPKRTGTTPELYPDVKSADICTDPDCFAAKKVAHFARVKTEAKAEGKTVIEGEDARKLMPDDYSAIKGYIKLDNKCYDAEPRDGNYPTYREILAEQTLPVVLLEAPGGKLVEVVEEAAVKNIAEEVGLPQRNSGSGNTDKEREAKAKVEGKFRKRYFNQIRTAFRDDITEHGAVLEEPDMILVARQFLARTWHENQKRLAAMWVETEEKIDAHERILRLTNMIDTMSAVQLCQLLMDLSLINMIHVGPYDQLETPEPLINTGRRLGVSPDTIRREVDAELEAKANRGKGGKKADTPETPVPTPEPAQPETTAEEADTDTTSPKPATEDTPEENPAKESRKTSSVSVLYFHPMNAELTWSGRGRKPKWVEHWLNEGGSLEQLLAKKRPAHKPKGSKSAAAACDMPAQRCDKTIELPGLPPAESISTHPVLETA